MRTLPTHIESKAVVFCGERDLGALGEVEDVALDGVHLVARLVADVEAAFEYDLHLVVRVFVDERRALLETIEAA